MKLSQIKLDAELMMRPELDSGIVDDYAQSMLNGDKFPPVVIFNDGDHNYLVDGFKRYHAHKKNGLEIIDADVRMGTYDDAFDYAFKIANRQNGERYSIQAKRYQLGLAFNRPRYADLSDRELSRILGVSHTFVSKHRKGEQPEVIKTTRNGKIVEVQSNKKDEDEYQEDPIFEMQAETQRIINENEALQNRLAVAAMEATDEEKQLAKSLLEDKDEKIRLLEADNRVLKASRDGFQRDVTEITKQCRYWEKRAKKAEALLSTQGKS